MPSATMQSAKVAILDAGAQFAKVIDRRVRELSVESDILPLSTKVADLESYAALIISGGPQSVYGPEAPKYDPDLFSTWNKTNKPILGICYGMQLINHVHGGTVVKKDMREDGQFEIKVDTESPLYKDLKGEQSVLLTHGDSVDRVAPGFSVTSRSSNDVIASIENKSLKTYATQFHPEVDLTVNGKEMLGNFLFEVCKLEPSFTVANREEVAIDEIRSIVGEKKVLLLVSGGVDSTVCAALLRKALPADKLIALHVDHGFMRKDESSKVVTALKSIGVELRVYDGAAEFLAATTNLKKTVGVENAGLTKPLGETVSPEEKRKIIGDTFMVVTQKAVADLGLAPEDVFLAQGTLRPDLIESASDAVSSNATVIKTHHNDTDLVRALRNAGRIVEPLKDYHKDEVRALGMQLGLPERLVWRQPFPGPGLAIRIICADKPYLTSDFADINTKLESIVQGGELGVHATLLPVRTVGVQGDGRSYSYIAALSLSRASGATAATDCDWPSLLELAKRIPREAHSVNRVVFVFGDPVPGPVQDITDTRLQPDVVAQLRHADHIVNEVLFKYKLTKKISQVPVVLFPVPFGVDGNRSIGIRTFMTNDFMTGSPACPGRDLPFEAIDEMVTGILDNVEGITRVAFDLTPKPPATTEWE